MVVASQAASAAVVLGEGRASEDNLLPALVGPEAAILSAVPALVDLPLDRPPQLASVVEICSTRTNLQADSLVDNQVPQLQEGCLGPLPKLQASALEAQEHLARLEAVQILSVPVNHKTSRVSLEAPAVDLEELVLLQVDCSVVLARPGSAQTSRHRARTPLVLSARRINKVSKVKTKTSQEVSLAAEVSAPRRLPNHSHRAASLEGLSLQRAAGDYSVAVRLDKARLGSGPLARAPVEVFLAGRAHNSRSQVFSEEAAASEARRIKAAGAYSVAAVPQHNPLNSNNNNNNNNKAAFLEELPRTILVVSSVTLSSSKSPAFLDPPSRTPLTRTTVSSAGRRPTVFSTLYNKANRPLNNLRRFIRPSWMAILMGNRLFGLGFPKPHHKIRDLSLPPYRPASA
jgi:hypothetical protein